MRLVHLTQFFAIVLVLTICVTRSTRAEDPAWEPIMDGKTLAGWHKNGLGNWTVEEGAFVGRSNKARLYGHLVSDEQFQDFTVRFKFQCTSGDSGFFIRTQMQDPDKTIGLQIQVGPCGSGTGGIYESYGRAWLQKPTKQQEAFCYREGQWNEMIIAAKGSRVTVHVNGFKTADLNDDKIKREAGVLALQMHSGVVNQTMFRDLAILEKGEIVPRRFLYDAVETVKPSADGSLVLHAADAMSAGPAIMYMPDWSAMGRFTDKDQVSWPLQVDQAGDYDVWLEWSVDDDHAGRPFVLEVGNQRLTGTVGKTGSWKTYKTAEIGQLKLEAGAQQAVFKPNGQFTATLLNLRRIKLVPVERASVR